MDEESQQTKPTISVSLSRKLNLGNFESADAFVSISGLSVDANQDEIDALLDVGELAWQRMRPRLSAKCKEIKDRTTGIGGKAPLTSVPSDPSDPKTWEPVPA